MHKLKDDAHGFITLIIALVAILVTVVVLVYLRVASSGK